jgi:hypothetical protein
METMAQFAAAESGEGFTYEEFFLLTRRLFKSNEWCGLIELHELLQDSLPQTSRENPLLVISKLSSDEVSNVCKAFGHGLEKVLNGFSLRLNQTLKETERRVIGEDSKFAMAASEHGLPDDKKQKEAIDAWCRSQFSLVKTPADVIYACMESEHCHTPDSNIVFMASKAETTAKTEWDIVVSNSSDVNTKERIIPDIYKLASECDSKVSKEEILSVVLYTGPMVMMPEH